MEGCHQCQSTSWEQMTLEHGQPAPAKPTVAETDTFMPDLTPQSPKRRITTEEPADEPAEEPAA